jgi:hypothetical protein
MRTALICAETLWNRAALQWSEILVVSRRSNYAQPHPDAIERRLGMALLLRRSHIAILIDL